MAAERPARGEHRPEAEIGAAVDEDVVDIGHALEELLDLALVDEAPVEQQAPVAVAEREGEPRVVVEHHHDLALVDHRHDGAAPIEKPR